MKNLTAIFPKSLATLSALVFVIAAIVGLMLVNAERLLLNPDPYKRALIAGHFYERVPALFADQLLFQFDQSIKRAGLGDEVLSGQPKGQRRLEKFKTLTRADYEAILTDLLPAGWAQAQAENVMDQVFAYLNSEAQEVPVTLSLVEVKARLSGDEGVQSLMRIIASWPPCSGNQLPAWSLASSAQFEDLPTCRPPETVLAAVTPALVRTAHKAAADDIPDEHTVTRLGSSTEDVPEEALRQLLRQIRSLSGPALLLALASLALIALSGVRSWAGLLRGWGIPFLLAGLALGGLALLLVLMMGGISASLPTLALVAGISPALLRAAFEVGRAVGHGFVIWIGVEAALLGLLGLAMVIGAARVRPKPAAELANRPIFTEN